MIDLVGKDSLVSDLVQDEVYLVGNNNSRTFYVCKRDGNNLLYVNFTSNLSLGFANLVVNNTHIKGLDKNTGKYFEETLRFDEVGVQELLYSKIPSYAKVDGGVGYIKEYLPHDVITIR